jgi:hypothetical protein
MVGFAIVAEGITDQIVLKNIILAYYDDREPEPLIVFEQPPLDTTGTAGLPHPAGGWTLVVRYLRERKYRQALQLNQYVVIQIDSDIAAELGVPRPSGCSDEAFIELIINKLCACIDGADLPEVRERLLFAIGFDEIECWLLPLIFDRSDKSMLAKDTGCLEAINHKLRRLNEAPLSTAGDGKDPTRYMRISSRYRRRRQVEDAATNPGLANFLQQLASCTWVPPGAPPEDSSADSEPVPPGEPKA